MYAIFGFVFMLFIIENFINKYKFVVYPCSYLLLAIFSLNVPLFIDVQVDKSLENYWTITASKIESVLSLKKEGLLHEDAKFVVNKTPDPYIPPFEMTIKSKDY